MAVGFRVRGDSHVSRRGEAMSFPQVKVACADDGSMILEQATFHPSQATHGRGLQSLVITRQQLLELISGVEPWAEGRV